MRPRSNRFCQTSDSNWSYVARSIGCLISLFAITVNVGCREDSSSSEETSTNQSNSNSSGDSSADQPSVFAGTGIMVGGVSDQSALVQLRTSTGNELVDGDLPGIEATVVFELAIDDGSDSGDPLATQTVASSSGQDFIARAFFDELQPNTRYVCRTQLGSDANQLTPGPVARFRTHAGQQTATPFRFVVVTGMNYAKFHGDNRIDRERHVEQNNTELPAAYDGDDKRRGYPGLATIASMEPDFFIGTGDNVYYDTPTDPRAETIEEMRQKWHEQFVQPRYHELFASVPTYWEVDDHDYRIDDCDNDGDYLPSPDLGKQVLLEQLPYAPMDETDPLTYRTYRVSQDLQIWLTENRLHRSANATEDGPDKTIWGVEQREWLKRTLLESDATFKVLISPTPMIGPDDLRKKDNHTNIGGFRHERDEFFQWLSDNGFDEGHFYLVCGDRHWQYHAVHPTGREEFSCGALVDANSRLGRKPGDPQSTDPDGLIQQPYYQTPASGGFLMVECLPAQDNPATLAFKFYDEQGELLYEHQKLDN